VHAHARANTQTHTDVRAVVTHLYREADVSSETRYNTTVFPRGDVTIILLLLLHIPLPIKKVTPTTCHFTMTDDAMCRASRWPAG
jgi:hypothetical protein